MKKAAKHPPVRKPKAGEQPKPFTPGFTKAMVRQHAYELFRDKLRDEGSLTLEDWVLAEKDLVNSLEADLRKRGQVQSGPPRAGGPPEADRHREFQTRDQQQDGFSGARRGVGTRCSDDQPGRCRHPREGVGRRRG